MDKIARIRQEIDKRYAEYRAKMKTDDFTYYEGMADALDLFEQFLDTLSEEPDKSLEEEIATWIPAHISIRTDETLPLNPTELADACKEWGKCIARHFAEWQKEQMLKEAVESEAEELYNDGESQCTVSVGTYFKPGEKVYVLKTEEE